MTTSSPLFDINQLTTEEQEKFTIVHNELQPNYTSYLQYKLSLELDTKFEKEEEENEWHYELHRFLRARKWNVPHTIKCLVEMIKWRMDNHVDLILEHKPTSDRVNLLQKIVPFVDHGYTKTDRPLYIEKSGLFNVDRLLNSFQPGELIQCHIYWLELHCRLARERSRQIGKHIESFALLHDLNGCKVEMRKVLPLFKQSINIDDTYYPERLAQMFLVNPPAIFPILWNLVKHWLDPVTKTKIVVVKKGSDISTILLQHIDSDQLPCEYGGSCHSCSTAPDCIPVFNWSKDINSDK
ncbi:unnamed protein product [Adineta steineri]|uniref:CRAL-TRIO domain-containing protein n=1 Tax=Adineta steineri TaxID=433720 RepID=A0A815DIA9_9BILA|nr:unnamed protein product [Adineta steineri]CAF1297706.1 unnamed protein product [Adineta steineri]CAF3701709.1 unnamed protein product [Adineta steineri]CAF3742682.1 unnamed protein product [Adineta steineri]